MTGPAGGRWFRVDAAEARHRCHQCGSLFATGHVYHVGITTHVALCDGCAAGLTREEER